MTKKHEGPSDLPPIDWSAFNGLETPSYTQTPDAIFDWIMAYLTGAELKVLLYIVRRTFGFKKASDAISIDQLCHGIVTRDGRRLDLGTGLKRSTVLEAVRSLRTKRLIVAYHQSDLEVGTRPTVYALNLRQPRDGSEIAEQMPGARHDRPRGMPEHTPPSGPADPGVYREVPPGLPGRLQRVDPGRPPGSDLADPQQTVTQQTGRQETDQEEQDQGEAGVLLLLDHFLEQLVEDRWARADQIATRLGIAEDDPVVEIASLAAELIDAGVEPAVARELARANPKKTAYWLDHPEWWKKAQNPAALLVKRLREEKPSRMGPRRRGQLA